LREFAVDLATQVAQHRDPRVELRPRLCGGVVPEIPGERLNGDVSLADHSVAAMDLRIFTEPNLGASYDDRLALAKATEAHGFDAFFRSDHYMRFDGSPGLPGSTDAWITLAGIARETSRIRLGTLVSPVTFRLPGPLAISVAQVDIMSGGRVELGLGAGWFEPEHSAFAIPFPSTRTRMEMLEEQLAIVSGLWETKEGDRFSFDGAHYAVTDSPALPKPAQSPRPPIIVGGSGARWTPRLAATYADECNVPMASVEACVEQRDNVVRACEARGRDPETMTFSAHTVVCCGRNDEEVARRADVIAQSVDAPRSLYVDGRPDEVIEKLHRYTEVGVTRVYLYMVDIHDLDHLALLAEEVLPSVS
jgi:F420-dependent oxidoreductase-like protein